eukprot:21475-Heterococcus_DN1.PRE.6
MAACFWRTARGLAGKRFLSTACDSLWCQAMTLEYHHGKHHAAYVTKLNAAIASDSSLADKSLEEIMLASSGGVFNNAGQVWNHNFYWNSVSPDGGGQPTGAVADAINWQHIAVVKTRIVQRVVITESFGDFDKFKAEFETIAGGHFGSGWAWLVQKDDGKLEVVATHDASNPIKEGKGKPLITCDVWEHAYYIDYRNSRVNYLAAWWNLVNWEFANKNLAQS